MVLAAVVITLQTRSPEESPVAQVVAPVRIFTTAGSVELAILQPLLHPKEITAEAAYARIITILGQRAVVALEL